MAILAKKGLSKSEWDAYAEWENNTGCPVSLFSATWTVPPHPKKINSQTIYLFIGIQDRQKGVILQPVLQWGRSCYGGEPNSWSVASYYVEKKNKRIKDVSQFVEVQPGDELVGVITRIDNSYPYHYTSEFRGIQGTSLPIKSTRAFPWCEVTLETHNLTYCTEYPDTTFTSFSEIKIKTDNMNPTLNWRKEVVVNNCGLNVDVKSNSSTQGIVDIYYR